MGLRFAIALAIVGALVFAGIIGLAATPKRARPRALLVVGLVAVLMFVGLGVFLAAPAAPAPAAPVDDALTLYYTGRSPCGSSPLPIFTPSCSGDESVYALRARDGSGRWAATLPPVAESPDGPRGYGGQFEAGPLFKDGILYQLRHARAAARRYSIVAVRASDGKGMWEAVIGDDVYQMQLSDEGILVFTASEIPIDGPAPTQMIVLRGSDGSEARRVRLPGMGPFALADGVAYGVTYGPENNPPAAIAPILVASRLTDGKELWRAGLRPNGGVQGPYPSVLVVSGGLVFVAAPGADTLYALHTGDGSVAWQIPASSVGNLTVAGDALLVSVQPSLIPPQPYNPGLPDKLLALGAADGVIRWQQPLTGRGAKGFLAVAPVVADGVIYVGGGDLRALRLGDGTVVWRRGGGERGYATPVVAGGVVFARYGYLGGPPRPFGSQFVDGSLLALGASDGRAYWDLPLHISGLASGAA